MKENRDSKANLKALSKVMQRNL